MAGDGDVILDVWHYPLRFGDTLSNHDWVPLYVNRLLTSRFVAYSCTEDRRAAAFSAVLLWSESFRQDPAGTLPRDDVELMQLARYRDLEAWRADREWTLYGWREVVVEGDVDLDHSRLGHPLIASVSVDMHRRKRGRDEARTAMREAQHRTRVRTRLRALGWKKGVWDSPQVVDTVAAWLRTRDLYITDDNVRMAMSEAVGIPNVVAIEGGRKG